MPNLNEMLVPMKIPYEDEVVAFEHKPLSPEVRKELEAKLARSAQMVIDLRR